MFLCRHLSLSLDQWRNFEQQISAVSDRDLSSWYDLHNGSVVTEDHNANVIRLQIQRHPFQTGREFNHFTSRE